MQHSTDNAATVRSRDLKLCGLALAVMLVFAGAGLVALEQPWLRRPELVAFDAQTRVRGALPPGPQTVIVMIDDETIANVGRWPVPRAELADLIGTLHRAGARTIGIDMLLTDRESGAARGDDRSLGDASLAQAIREAGNVVLPFAFRFGGQRQTSSVGVVPVAYTTLHARGKHRPLALAPTGLVTPLAELAEHATLGHVLVAYDVDGAARYDYPALEFDLDYYPSMAVRIVQQFLGVEWRDVAVELGTGITLGRVRIPTDPAMRLLVNHLGPSPAFPTYSLSQVRKGAVPASAFRDRIVLVGSNVVGTRDTFDTPFTAVMPGVERLATVVDSILNGRHVRRPAAVPLLETAFMLGAAVVMGAAVSRLSLALASLCGVALVIAVAMSAQVAMSRFGVWQASAIPMVAIVVTFIALSLYRYGLLDKESRHIRRVFQRYLAPSMVERVVASPNPPQLGGELRELTILFCDLRGFTAMSERLPPDRLTRVVNQFLQAATDAVLEHGGTVDKYVGDAIMAFWNAPIDQPDHALLACRAALRIREKLAAINAASGAEAAIPALEAGIGINTGICTVGNFGSNHRFDYSAIGDPVNIAARLEGENKTYGTAILLGPETAARVSELALRPIGSVRLRGRAEALEVHALLAGAEVRVDPRHRQSAV